MLRRRRIGWKVSALAWAGLLAAPGPSAAGARDEELFLRPSEEWIALFAGLDVGRSVFASGGSKQALTGPLDRSGWVQMELTGFGLTRERAIGPAGDLAVLRYTHETSVSGGYQWALNGLYLAAFAGPEVQQEQLTVGGRLLRWSQPHLGARVQADLWANPTDATLLTGTIVASSTRMSFYGRGSAGLRVWGGAFVGPEVTVYSTATYSETRWGVHVTAFRIWRVNLRASAGWMTDDAHRRGAPYCGLSAWIRL